MKYCPLCWVMVWLVQDEAKPSFSLLAAETHGLIKTIFSSSSRPLVLEKTLVCLTVDSPRPCHCQCQFRYSACQHFKHTSLLRDIKSVICFECRWLTRWNLIYFLCRFMKCLVSVCVSFLNLYTDFFKAPKILNLHNFIYLVLMLAILFSFYLFIFYTRFHSQHKFLFYLYIYCT